MKRIGTIQNTYGDLKVWETEGSYYWRIDDEATPSEWEEIPEYLYLALLKFEEERDRG